MRPLVAGWRSPTSGALSPGRTRPRRRSGCQAVLGTRVGGPVAWRRPEGTSAAKTKSLGVGYLSRECVPALRSTPLLVSTVGALPAASALTGRRPASCVVRRFKETSRRLCPRSSPGARAFPPGESAPHRSRLSAPFTPRTVQQRMVTSGRALVRCPGVAALTLRSPSREVRKKLL